MSLCSSYGLEEPWRAERIQRVLCNPEDADLSALELLKPFEWQRQQLREAVTSWTAAFTVSPAVMQEVGQKGLTRRVKTEVTCHRLFLPLVIPVSTCLPIRSPLQNSWQLPSPVWASSYVMENHCHAINAATGQSAEGIALKVLDTVKVSCPSTSAIMQPGRSDCNHC